jgi:hypothetical protein
MTCPVTPRLRRSWYLRSKGTTMTPQAEQQLIHALQQIAQQLQQIAHNTSNLNSYLNNIANAAGRR